MMKIILIGNYPLDKQESMKRFADMLEDGFKTKGIETEIWLPTVFFASFYKNTTAGIGKWLGYIDKWILFPVILKWRILKHGYKSKDVKFHICDHSNSPYLPSLPYDQASITCHDVLAIRAARGHADAHVTITKIGRKLQNWILKNLIKAKKISCVSQLTLNQLLEFTPIENINNKEWLVIHNAFNNDFQILDSISKRKLLNGVGISEGKKYLMIVGSNLERKNRALLLNMLKSIESKWDGDVCFAGQPITEELKKKAVELKLESRIFSVVKPNHELLVALYNGAEAFVFPSFSEGFGWPIIEAQACGVPVITSNIEPMPEVSGGGALLADPYSPEDFAVKFIQLQDLKFRQAIIDKGLENTKRFQPALIIDRYLEWIQSK